MPWFPYTLDVVTSPHQKIEEDKQTVAVPPPRTLTSPFQAPCVIHQPFFTEYLNWQTQPIQMHYPQLLPRNQQNFCKAKWTKDPETEPVIRKLVRRELATLRGKNEQKNLLGNVLFPLIKDHEPDLAGKITGMLLEMENDDLLELLGDSTALKRKLMQAMKVLQSFSKTEWPGPTRGFVGVWGREAAAYAGMHRVPVRGGPLFCSGCRGFGMMLPT